MCPPPRLTTGWSRVAESRSVAVGRRCSANCSWVQFLEVWIHSRVTLVDHMPDRSHHAVEVVSVGRDRGNAITLDGHCSTHRDALIHRMASASSNEELDGHA